MARRKATRLPRNLQRLSGDRLHELVEEREALFRAARAQGESAGPGHGLAEAERLRAEVQQTTEELKLLRGEQRRRQEEAPLRQSFLRAAAASVGANSTHELLAHEQQQAETQARKRAEQERARAVKVRAQAAVDAKRQHSERVQAGLEWEPVGGWAGGDTLAALFGSQVFWRQFVLDRHGPDRMPLLALDHIGHLAAILVAVAENGGKPARFNVRKWPNLPFGTGGSRDAILEHLVGNGLLTLVERSGPLSTVGLGPEVERLAEGFRSEMRQRTKPKPKPSVAEEAAGWLEDVKRWAAGVKKGAAEKPGAEKPAGEGAA